MGSAGDYYKFPKCLVLYNKYMGGADVSDQKRSYYTCRRRSSKWWHAYFYLILDTVCVNSHAVAEKVKGRKIDRLDFMTALAKQLMGYQAVQQQAGFLLNTTRFPGAQKCTEQAGAAPPVRKHAREADPCMQRHLKALLPRTMGQKRCRWCEEASARYFCTVCKCPYHRVRHAVVHHQ